MQVYIIELNIENISPTSLLKHYGTAYIMEQLQLVTFLSSFYLFVC